MSKKRKLATTAAVIGGSFLGWVLGGLFLRSIASLHFSHGASTTFYGLWSLALIGFAFAASRWHYWWDIAGVTDCETEGVEAINDERYRQLHKHGWTPEHDDKYDADELERAAGCYLTCAIYAAHGQPLPGLEAVQLTGWPWDRAWFKPSDDPRENLAKAGALIAAAYDRLDRCVQCESCDRWTPNVAVDEHGVYLCEKTCAQGIRDEEVSDAEEA